MPLRVCVLGDRFVLPELIPDLIRQALGDQAEVSIAQLEWPDGETISGKPGDAIREYSGRADDVIRLARGADALIVHMAPITREVIDALPELKFVAVCRGGPVNVDAQAAQERGIHLARAPGRNANAVAEFTIGALIAGSRSLVTAATEVRNGVWSRGHYRYADASIELAEMTVGLIGYSHVGRKVGHLLKAFSAHVLFADPYQEPDDTDSALGIEKVDLEALCARSDVVSVHARLTDATRKMCDAAFFARLKDQCVFINTARGELVDEAALLAELESGKVRMAILDTFDPEPPAPDSALVRHPNVIATPHLAGASRTSAHIVARMVVEELEA